MVDFREELRERLDEELLVEQAEEEIWRQLQVILNLLIIILKIYLLSKVGQIMEDGLIHECKEADTTDSEQGMPGKVLKS